MSIVDWSKAPEWATCVVKHPLMKEDLHWSEDPKPHSQLMKIEDGVSYKMGIPTRWVIVEERPASYPQLSKADVHLAHLFTPGVQPSMAPDLLKQTAQLLAERGKQYDTSGEERSAAKIVAAFNAVTGRDLTPGEGWLFLMMLKAVRFYSNTETPHRDSLEDLIAYSALHAEEYLKDE